MAALREQQPDHIVEDEWLDPAMGTANFMDQGERLGIVGALSLLGLLTTLVLVVAAANVGNLVLSRATGRSRELGVRVALGAKRSRIVRQLVIETLPLAMLGAAGGITLANWAADTIAAIGGDARQRQLRAGLAHDRRQPPPERDHAAGDWRHAGVEGGAPGIDGRDQGRRPAGVAQPRQGALAPFHDGGASVRQLLDPRACRDDDAHAATRARRTIWDSSTSRPPCSSPGWAATGSTAAGAIAYWNTVKARVEQHPETAALALALAPPLGGRVRGNSYDDAPGLEVVSNSIEPEFFEVMEIPLVLGRTFQDGDDPATTVIISRALAMAMYGSMDVLGRGFPRSKPVATIVGVAGDAHAIRVEAVDTSELYRPLAAEEYVQAVLIVRARGDAATLAPVLSEAASMDSRILPGVGLLRDSFERRVAGTRVASGIAAGTGLLTLVIACLGIFGVVSYGATLRIKEFGIHLALGAERGRS